jgi:hypothetical protein
MKAIETVRRQMFPIGTKNRLLGHVMKNARQHCAMDDTNHCLTILERADFVNRHENGGR